MPIYNFKILGMSLDLKKYINIAKNERMIKLGKKL
jgi:hypothetical protein